VPERWHLATPEAALLSPGALEIDPIRLTRALLAMAMQRGCRLLSPLRVAEYEIAADGVTIHCEQGLAVRASRLVLASGYEMPPFVQATTQFDVTSTWAMATAPQPQGPLSAMLWEAAEPYIYLRSTADGRLMIGGGDAPVADTATREALAPEKIARLQQRLAELLPQADTRIATSWSGRFGVTADGLPLIGPVPDHPGCFAAYGYGGNGVTFSMIAADLLVPLLAGDATAEAGQAAGAAAAFALDR
jgi:glycine/D-amino acid oxidase-like deaminating enzyme